MALADVVFPMPISPKPKMSHPAIAESQASSIPVSRAAFISTCVIAGPLLKLRVPAAARLLISSLESGSGVAAQASLARTSLLLAAHEASVKAEPLRAEAPEDCDDRLENTAWGPAHRLKPPVVIAGAPMRWERPAAPIGSDAPRWGASRI